MRCSTIWDSQQNGGPDGDMWLTGMPVGARKLGAATGAGPHLALGSDSSSIDPLDGLSRQVYGVLGIPIDAISIGEVAQRIDAAAKAKEPFLISTPNLNFLVSSLYDADFRESLLLSDLCPVDGVPIVWIARLLSVPIQSRVAGSDIFDALKALSRRTTGFLFGGPPGVADAAARTLNAQSSGMYCVGTFYPGYCSVEEMSTDNIIEPINATKAEFLVVSLGAKKGQDWLVQNHHRLTIPVRSHLGAAINFEGGTLKRAPKIVRKCGVEWLWRIKEEPHLWIRYWKDGWVLLRLMLTCVLPLAVSLRWHSHWKARRTDNLVAEVVERPASTMIRFAGAATANDVEGAIRHFRAALSKEKDVVLDLSRLEFLDARFFGLFLMVRKQLRSNGRRLGFSGLSGRARKIFRLNGFDYLLDKEDLV